MARSVCGGALPPSRGTRRSFQNRFAESIFRTNPLSGRDLCTPSGQRPRARQQPAPDRTRAIPYTVRAEAGLTGGRGRGRRARCVRSAGQRRVLTVTHGQPNTAADLRTGRLTRCANRPSKLVFGRDSRAATPLDGAGSRCTAANAKNEARPKYGEAWTAHGTGEAASSFAG
jgi:hypothetical protein